MNKRKTFIPIPALLGALLLALVATMTPFVADPDIAHAQATPALLGGLTVTGTPSSGITAPPGATYSTLSPSFETDGSVTEYSVRIPYAETGVDVTATLTTAEIITVNGTTVTSGTAHAVDLRTRGGMTTTITIVASESGKTTTTYTVKVYRERQARSNNANLASLGLTGGNGVSLSPTFSPSKASYDARVQFPVGTDAAAAQVTVAYTLDDTRGGASAAITSTTGATVAGMKVTLGAEGTSTNITVTVTPESGTGGNKPYVINVYRIRANQSTDVSLSGLVIGAVDATGTDATDTVFDANGIDHSSDPPDFVARVSNSTRYLKVVVTKTDLGAVVGAITPADALDADGHQVELDAGAVNTITFTVTAEDPRKMETYTIKVYRNGPDPLSTENNLDSLSLSGVQLTPGFAKSIIGYTARVASNVGKVTVNCVQTDRRGGASLSIAATSTDASYTAAAAVQECGKDVTLGAEGTTTTITIAVTPEDSTAAAKTYSIAVYRLRAQPSADATLGTLTVAPISGALTPAFVATGSERMFSATALSTTSSVTINAIAARSTNGATVDITPADANASTPAHEVNLTAGMRTMVTVTVTAEDASTTETYTIDIYRQNETLSKVNTLSDLSLSMGQLSPTFTADQVEYTARVGNDVDKVTVSATPTDNDGGVDVKVKDRGGTVTACSAVDYTTGTGNEVGLGSGGTKTTICVQVTPENGVATDIKRYMITVYRMRGNPSGIADLRTFQITDASGAPTGTLFGSTTSEVAAGIDLRTETSPDVGYRVRSVLLTVDPSDIGAQYSITPADAVPGTEGHQINLMEGANTEITVVVTPEDPAADTKTYTATVYRQRVGLSDVATLSDLMLSGTILQDTDGMATDFMSNVMAYRAAAAYSAKQTTVTPMVTDPGANYTITVPAADADNNMAGYQVSLTGSDADRDMDGHQTKITVQVRPESVAASAITTTPTNNSCTAATASDRHAKIACYTVTVTRPDEAGTDASLSSLSLMYTDDMMADMDVDLTDMDGMMVDFAADTMMYYASVGSDVGMIKLMAAATAPATTMTVMYGDGMTADETAMMDDDGYYSVSLMEGENTVEVEVTAEDGTTMETYTVMVTRESSEPPSRRDELLAIYDGIVDGTTADGMIDGDELNVAIGHYLADPQTLVASDLNILIGIYLE